MLISVSSITKLYMDTAKLERCHPLNFLLILRKEKNYLRNTYAHIWDAFSGFFVFGQFMQNHTL